jgi:hypothetical protein
MNPLWHVSFTLKLAVIHSRPGRQLTSLVVGQSTPYRSELVTHQSREGI